MAPTSIEWTDVTWNPVRGCEKVSPGCANCYAETFAERWRGVPGHPYEQGFDLRLVPGKLTEPLAWKKAVREDCAWCMGSGSDPTGADHLSCGYCKGKGWQDRPRRVFVNSMSDLFQDGVPDEYIARVFSVMARAPQLTFQILTKRADRMLNWFMLASLAGTSDELIAAAAGRWPLPNVWLGVSVENQHFADERIPLLLKTPAAVRFISAEPLLAPIDLHSPVLEADSDGYLDWVIVGGESGAGARPFNLEWARAVVQQCRAAGVPCFVKQLGSNLTANYYDDDTEMWWEGAGREWPDPIGWHHRDGQPELDSRVRLHLKKKGGEFEQLPPDLQVREFPKGLRAWK